MENVERSIDRIGWRGDFATAAINCQTCGECVPPPIVYRIATEPLLNPTCNLRSFFYLRSLLCPPERKNPRARGSNFTWRHGGQGWIMNVRVREIECRDGVTRSDVTVRYLSSIGVETYGIGTADNFFPKLSFIVHFKHCRIAYLNKIN